MYMNVLPVCVYVHHVCILCEPVSPGVRRGHWVPGDLELWMIVSHPVGAESQTWVFSKSSRSTAEPCLQPKCPIF